MNADQLKLIKKSIMEKLKENVYFKKIDLHDEMWKFDKFYTGSVTQEDFSRGLSMSNIVFTNKEVSEILDGAPYDRNGKILYKEFQRKLKNEHLEEKRKFKRPIETPEYTQQTKLATALHDQLKHSKKDIISDEDLNSMLSSSWLKIDNDYLRELWPTLPHNRKKLKKWTKKHRMKSLKQSLPLEYHSENPYPIIMHRLKDTAIVYGSEMVVSPLRYKTFLYNADLRQFFKKLNVIKNEGDFDEFREWAIQEGLMKLQGNDLVIDGAAFCEHFKGLDRVESEPDTPDLRSDIQVVVNKAVRSIVKNKLSAVGNVMKSHSRNEYIEEHNFREIVTQSITGLSPEDITVMIHSMKYTLHNGIFKQIYIPEFVDLFIKTDYELNVEMEPPEKQESEAPVEYEQKPLELEFIPPRDTQWETDILKKVYAAHKDILINFQTYDPKNTGSLLLEEFHYVMVKSCPWLSSQEINIVVQFAIREAGVIDNALTDKTRFDMQAHASSRSISYALFPDGTRYRISYFFFAVCLEKILTSN